MWAAWILDINDNNSNLLKFETFCNTDDAFCILKDEFEKIVLGLLKL